MKLYDNDSFREQFMETVYDVLSDDPDNTRANRIISAFDDAPPVEAVCEDIPFEDLPAMNGRSVYMVCWDDPAQNGWADLQAEKILGHPVFRLKFLDGSKRRLYLTKEEYRRPWVPCYRPTDKEQACVFVFGERFRRLQADYEQLKRELDAFKAEHSAKPETA